MSFDNSRFPFNPWSDFSGVVMQQGRVQLDSDWNEWLAELSRRIQAGTLDTMGRAVYPATTPYAFLITASASGGTNTLTVGPGRMYVDGLLAENHGDPNAAQWDPALAELSGSPQPPPATETAAIDFTKQPYMPAGTTLPPGSGPFLAYLDVWIRELSYLEDPDLIDKAVGVDTTGRLQTVWQVKLFDLANSPGASCNSDISGWPPPPSAGLLTTGTALAAPSGPCCLTSGAAYTGMENQFYRVEIHQPGTPVSGATPPSPLPAGTATFKWSRDNASVMTSVSSIANVQNSQGDPASQLAVQSLGRDQVLGFAPGNWIEILDDDLEFAGLPGELHQIDSVDYSAKTITLATTLGAQFNPGDTDPNVHTRIQRWDQSGKIYEKDGTTVWWDLDTQGGDIPVPPVGTSLMLENGIIVSFDLDAAITLGAFRTGDFWTFAARTADGSIEILQDARPRGIHHHYARLSIVTFPNSATDCRTKWPPSTGETESCGCCCTVTVGNGVESVGKFTSIQQAINSLPAAGGEVCVLPGRYFENIFIRDRRDVLLRGCGWQTRIASGSLKPAPPPAAPADHRPGNVPDVAGPRAGPAPAPGAAPANTFPAVITVASSQHIQLLSFAVEAAADEVGILLDGTGKLSAGLGDVGNVNVANVDAVRGFRTVLDVTLDDLVLTASTLPAVLAHRVRLLQMEACRVAIQDVPSQWPAVWVSGIEMRIVRNWIGLQNAANLQLWLPASVVGDLAADAGAGGATGETGIVSTFGVHPGGLQVGGQSRDVFVLENEIEGGSRNGITLGSLSVLDSQGNDTGTIIGVLVFPPDPCSKGGSLEVPVESPGTPGTRVVSGGKLLNILIERNRIRNMGLCGIGPVGFFNLLQELEIISIQNLTIASNAITRTMLSGIVSSQVAAFSIIGYGAICITDAENLTIRDNSITDFGVQPGTDVCGIFLLNGEMVDISGNHMLETRDWSQASAAAESSTGDARGGIVVFMATPPAFTTDYAYSQWKAGTNLAGAQQPTHIPSVPALRIENNVVRVPLAVALEATGLGVFAIQDNHLSCGGTVTEGGQPPAATVLIMNMGTAIEAAATSFSSLKDKNNAATFGGVAQRGFLNSSIGTVLFTGNVCQLEARASKQRNLAALMILTLDHMIFSNNHCWLDGPALTAFFDALLGAGSLQLVGNRFQEASGFPVTVSGLTIGLINIAIQNLSTYCLINFGIAKLVEANNVAIIDLGGQDLCAQLAKQLNS
jgi:hypothetical protein